MRKGGPYERVRLFRCALAKRDRGFTSFLAVIERT